MKREAGRVVALSLELGTSGFLVGGFLDGCDCGAVELHLHIVCDFDDEGFLLHIGDHAVDAGVGYDLIAGFDGIHEFGVFFCLLLLRADQQEVEDDEDENQRHHRNKDVRLRLARGCLSEKNESGKCHNGVAKTIRAGLVCKTDWWVCRRRFKSGK